MIQMSVGDKDRIEFVIRSRWRAIQRLRFLATLKQTAIEKNTGVLGLNDVTRTRYFAACCASEGDLHVIMSRWFFVVEANSPFGLSSTNSHPRLMHSPSNA